MKKIAILATNFKGLGGATTATIVTFRAFLSKGISCDLVDADFVNSYELRNYSHIHLPILGTVDERIGNEPRFIEQLLESGTTFSVDLRAPWELDIYPYSKSILESSKCKFITTISTKLLDFYISNPAIPKNTKIVFVDQFINYYPAFFPYKIKSVLCMSRITPSKSVHEFAEICDELEYQGCCMGAVNYDEYFNKLRNKPNFIYCGDYNLINIYEKIGNFSFIVDLSKYDNDGDRPQFTVMEAMASGAIPVIREQWCGRLIDRVNCISFREASEIPYLLNPLLMKSDLKFCELLNNFQYENLKLLNSKFSENNIKSHIDLINQ